MFYEQCGVILNFDLLSVHEWPLLILCTCQLQHTFCVAWALHLLHLRHWQPGLLQTALREEP